MRWKGKIIIRRKILGILVVIIVGIILSIYIYDILGCIFEESPIPLFELIIVVAILIGAISVSIILKKNSSSEMLLETSKQIGS